MEAGEREQEDAKGVRFLVLCFPFSSTIVIRNVLTFCLAEAQRLAQRNHIGQEVVESERSYLRSLRYLLDVRIGSTCLAAIPSCGREWRENLTEGRTTSYP